MKAELAYSDNSLEVYDLFFYAEDSEMGNPYNTVFKLRAVADGFSGVASFTYDIFELAEFVSQLEDMYAFKVECAELADIGDRNKVFFELKKTGKLCVHGTIYSVEAIQSLDFCFYADQTSLPGFISGLKTMLSEAGYVCES